MATAKKGTTSSSAKKKTTKQEELEAKLKKKAVIAEEDEIEEEEVDEVDEEMEEDEDFDEDAEESLEDADEEEEESDDEEESEEETEDEEESDDDEEEEDEEDEDPIPDDIDIPEPPVKKKSSKVTKLVSNQDILDKMNFDLDSIIIDREANDLKIFDAKDRIFNSKATKQVVCVQSGYIAQMSALKNNEMQTLMNNDADLYSSKKMLYKYIHNHMEDTSIGNIGFEEFLKNTSYFDVETLLFGIFCQTFPYENSFRTICNKPDCRKETSIYVNNNTLVEVRGNKEETYAKLKEILDREDTQALYNESIIHKTKRVLLEESKVVVDLVIPTLYDYIEGTLRGVNPQYLQENADAIGMYLFIDKILIPDIAKIRQTGKPSYIALNDKTMMIDTIAELSYNDNLQLSEEIAEFTDTYKVSYTIKGVKCSACHDEMDPVPVSMEEVLFRRISLGRQQPSNKA